jgi:hypothetical protein
VHKKVDLIGALVDARKGPRHAFLFCKMTASTKVRLKVPWVDVTHEPSRQVSGMGETDLRPFWPGGHL